MKKILVVVICMLAMPCVVYADAVMPDSAKKPVFDISEDKDFIKLQKELIAAKEAFLKERMIRISQERDKINAEYVITEIDYKNLKKEYEELVKKEAKNEKK